jgi:Spy/CpxP family protein refolding chaperone
MIRSRNRLAAGLVATAAFAFAAHPARSADDAGASAAPAAAAGAHAECPVHDGPHGGWAHGLHHWHEGHHGAWRGHRGPWEMLRALDLTGAQRQSVHAVFEQSRGEFTDLRAQMRANAMKLRASAPDDPGHEALVADVGRADGALVARMIGAREAVRTKVYALLTPAQKAKLGKMRARLAAQRAHGCDGRMGPGGKGAHWGRPDWHGDGDPGDGGPPGL